MDTHASEGILTPEFQNSPYPTYIQMREEVPLHKSSLPTPDGSMEAWLVTRYADAHESLSNPRLIKAGNGSVVGDDASIGPAELETSSTRPGPAGS